jgi:type III secretion protein U
MSGDTSEEKNLPASQRKLRKARERGQTVTSKEAVMSVTGVAALLYLHWMTDSITEKFVALFVLEIENSDRGFTVTLRDKLGTVAELGIIIVLPLLALVITMSILSGMVVAGGPIFSTEPLNPDFNKLNPVEGFKRIFSIKGLLTFLMNVLRIAIMGTVLGLILYAGWGAMLGSAACGFGCAVGTLSALVGPLVVAKTVMMLGTAVFDYLVQRRNFMVDQKMTLTEFKREMKDQMGDPHLRGRLRAERRQMAEVKTGAKHAIVVIAAPPNYSVAIRYVPQETPAPVVVAKARGGPAMRDLANASFAPEIYDPRLAQVLWRTPVGAYVVDEEVIDRLVPHIQQGLAQVQANQGR